MDGHTQKSWQGNFADYTSSELDAHAGMTYTHNVSGMVLEDPFDLNNLKFFHIEDAHKLHQDLETLFRERGDGKKMVAFIGTGGTIAMTNIDGVLVPKLDTETLMAELPSSRRIQFEAAAIQLPEMIDSSMMHPDVIADVVLLMTGVYNLMSTGLQQAFAGYVITHGTDTMAEQAAMCRMMLGRRVPFSTCFVGAQKTIDDIINDVSANLIGALSSLALAHDGGVSGQFVYMNGSSGSAMNPVGVVKISDSSVEAFGSPLHESSINAMDFAAEGIKNSMNYSDGVEARYNLEPIFRPIIIRKDVGVEKFVASPGRHPERDYQMAASFDPGTTDAIMMVTYGGFTYHPKNFAAVMRAADEKNIPVFVTNPFPAGSTDHEYGPAKFIRDNTNAIPVNILPSALVAKIHVAQAMFGHHNTEQIKDFVLNSNYVGEQPS